MKLRTQLWIMAAVTGAVGCAALTPEPPAEQDAEIRLERGLAALQAGEHRPAFDDLAWVYSQCHGREAGGRALLALAALELDPRNPDARPAVATDLLARAIRDPGTPEAVRPLTESAFLVALALGAPHPEGGAARTAGDTARPPVGTETPAGMVADSAAPTGAVRDSVVPAATADSLIAEARPDTLADRADTTMHVAADTAAEQPDRRRPLEEVAPELSRDAMGGTLEPVYGCGRVVDASDWIAPALPRLPGPSMAAMLRGVEQERNALAAHADTLRRELAAVREQLRATREELERIRATLRP